MLETFIFLIIFFIANIIQVLTGFGGTLLAMPFSIKLIDIADAKAVLNLMALIACSVIAIKDRKYICFKEFIKISGLMLIGIAAGLLLEKFVAQQILQYFYGAFIIIVAIFNLLCKKQFQLPVFLQIIIIICAGIIHGMYVSGGSLLVMYATFALTDKKEFRATLSLVWVLLNSALLIIQLITCTFSSYALILSALSILPLILSYWIGNLIYKKIDQKKFIFIVNILLIISGIVLLI